jgi:hypothetical protein
MYWIAHLILSKSSQRSCPLFFYCFACILLHCFRLHLDTFETLTPSLHTDFFTVFTLLTPLENFRNSQTRPFHRLLLDTLKPSTLTFSLNTPPQLHRGQYRAAAVCPSHTDFARSYRPADILQAGGVAFDEIASREAVKIS